MKQSDWQQIERVLAMIIEAPEAERHVQLEQLCGDDPKIRAEVESLLTAYKDASSFMKAKTQISSEVIRLLSQAESDFRSFRSLPTRTQPAALPSMIGRYRILRLLGEGGMGVVYEAEQEQPRRTVALKVIRGGATSPELLRRFEQESHALGQLHHPGIAQIYEAGTADNGLGPQPYFAMEFIRGTSLLQHAAERQLNTRQRLELMIKVCEAVHHAHQHGIIHRDLKPGNLLVEENGQPKILDFGVARVTNSEAQTTRQTDLGQLIGTLAYMSPEQVSADPREFDARSDVYALGVILFELLAGRLPYKISRQLHEAVQTIREEDPTPLSSVDRTYRGDIETIVGKALEKDKERRYQSAADLAADIERYLKDEPILARPPSATYQMQKFARRHKALVASAAVVFAVLVAGIITSTWEAARARRAEQAALGERDRATAAELAATQERDRALIAETTATTERNHATEAEKQAIQDRNLSLVEKRRADTEAATAKAVNDFLQNDLLAQASANTQARPDIKPDPELKVRIALDRAAARVSGKFDKQPLVEAAIRETIGNTYRDLGLYSDAQQQLERAFDLRQCSLGLEHRDTLDAMYSLAEIYWFQGKNAQAEPLYIKLLDAQQRILGEKDARTLDTMQGLADLKQNKGEYAQAEPLYIKVVNLRRQVLGEEDPNTLASMNNLAALYQATGKYPQAEQLYTGVLQKRQRVLGEEHPDTMISMNNLAVLREKQGRYAEAEPLYSKVLEMRQRVLGKEHPNTLISMNNLAGLYRNQGKYPESEALYSKALDIKKRVLGEEHPSTLLGMTNLAVVYTYEGEYTRADPLFAKVLQVRRRVQGEEHPYTLRTMCYQAEMYRDQGQYTQAEPLFTKVLESQQRTLGGDNPDTLLTMSDLADTYMRQEKYEKAEPLLVKVRETRQRTLGRENPATANASAALGQLRLMQQRYAEAELLLREALASEEKNNPDAWERYANQSMLGASLAAQAKFAEAEPELLTGYDGLYRRKAAIPSGNRSALEQAGARLVQLYKDWGKPEKAAQWHDGLDATASAHLW